MENKSLPIVSKAVNVVLPHYYLSGMNVRTPYTVSMADEWVPPCYCRVGIEDRTLSTISAAASLVTNKEGVLLIMFSYIGQG